MQAVAIIPAAGRSRRMGQVKLLLPWGNSTVIASVVAAWLGSDVQEVIAVVSPADAEIAEACRNAGATVVVPNVPPPNMKDSIQAAIRYIKVIQVDSSSGDPDCFLVAPADMPWIKSTTINRIVAAAAADSTRIVVPSHAGRRGHPIAVPWSLADKVLQLGDGDSLKTIVERQPIQTVECDESILGDLDTRTDYEAARKLWNT